MNLLALAFAALGGIGLSLVVAAVPTRRSRLAARISPYVADLTLDTYRATERLRLERESRWTIDGVARRILNRFGPGRSDLERIAAQAAIPGGASHIRVELTNAAAAGFALGAFTATTAAGISTLPRLLLGPIGAILCAAAWFSILNTRARARRARIERDLPAVLELLSLSVASGEALPNALRRVSAVGNGPLTDELAEVCRTVDLGTPLSEALAQCAARLHIATLTRLVQHLRAALERGAPIVDVLDAQTADQRVRFTQAALESAGRKEIAMMLPLVFLILPITVVFAIWPGLAALNLGFQP